VVVNSGHQAERDVMVEQKPRRGSDGRADMCEREGDDTAHHVGRDAGVNLVGDLLRRVVVGVGMIARTGRRWRWGGQIDSASQTEPPRPRRMSKQ